jgi:hypothetical protein
MLAVFFVLARARLDLLQPHLHEIDVLAFRGDLDAEADPEV